jgi:sugar lactone lactonase YvrE
LDSIIQFDIVDFYHHLNHIASSPPPESEGDVCLTATWAMNGITVAGGHGFGQELHQLADPYGLFLDVNDTIYIADRSNHRIVTWEQGASIGQLAAGVTWENNRIILLNMPQDLVVDKDGTMYIADGGNKRVLRWTRGAQNGEMMVEGIQVVGIGQDDEGSIYVSEYANGRLTKWRVGETTWKVIPTRLHHSNFLFVDQNRSIYIVGYMNHRVMKVTEGIEEAVIVAGQSDNSGNGADQLAFPTGVFVDQLGTVYVADTQNHRIMRWPKGATSGSLIIGGRRPGSEPDQLNYPSDVSFDRYGNIYVTDTLNNRVQKFVVDKSSCHTNKKRY